MNGFEKTSRGRFVLRVLTFLIVLVALVVLAMYASQWKKEVVVRDFVIDGASIISEKELLSRMTPYRGWNLQKLDLKELKKSVMVIPYLRDAKISKELNGIVRLRVFEREPIAMTAIGGQMMVIDREGFLLPQTRACAEQFPHLMLITGITPRQIARNGLQQIDRRDIELIRQFLVALSESEYACLLIREFHLAGNNMEWCLALRAPTRFIVGNDGNYKEKLKKFEIFWQKVVSKKGFDAYETVDLRFRDRIFTRDPGYPEVPRDVSL